MPRIYPHALLFDASTDSGSAPANAVYNDLPQLSVVMLAQFESPYTNAAVFSKGNNASGLNTTAQTDGRIDFVAQRSSGAALFRGQALATLDTWRWVCFTLDRTAVTHTRFGGPHGGTMATISASNIGSGSGAATSDAAFPWTLGSNGVNNGARNLRVAGFAVYSGVLTLPQFQEVADDLDTASVQPVAAWIPHAATTTSIPNLIVPASPALPLPAMALTGTTIVAGPDVAPSTGAVRMMYQLLT